MPATELVALKCKCQRVSPLLVRPDDPRLGPTARCPYCRKPFARDLAHRFGPAHWNACADVARMREVLAAVGVPVTVRKLRLGACYVCRTDFEWCRNPRFLEAVATAEAFADGQASDRDRERAHAYLRDLPHHSYSGDDWWSLGLWALAPEKPAGRRDDLRNLALPPEWYREAFGNPLDAVRFDPEWRTSTAIGLAREIVRRRAFHLFPYLADALMDAGCDDPRVRAHCDSNRPHARGCWLLDAVLGA